MLNTNQDILILDRFNDLVARNGHRETLDARFIRLRQALPIVTRVLQYLDPFGIDILKHLLGLGEAPVDEVIRYPELATPFFQKGWIDRPFQDNPSPLPRIGRYKRHIWLKILLRDRMNLVPLEHTLADLSELADDVCLKAFDPFPEGLGLWAMGKWGGNELNASSDIDPILFRTDALEPEEADKSVREWLKRFVPPGEPEVYRVDLRLRPEGDNGPLVFRYAKLEEYLMRRAAPWERIAYLRARLVHGDAPDWFESLLNSFLFPPGTDPHKRLEETAGMLFAIHQNASPTDIKRAPGGIRDVEFLVAGFQLAFGRQIKRLRKGTVLQLLDILADEGILEKEKVIVLSDGYRLLRTIENALQADGDRPVFTFPALGTPAAIKLAWGLGVSEEELMQRLSDKRELINQIVFGELVLGAVIASGWSDPQGEKEASSASGRLSSLARRLSGPWGEVGQLIDMAMIESAPSPETVITRLESAVSAVGGPKVWLEGVVGNRKLYREITGLIVRGALLCEEAQNFPGFWGRYGHGLPEPAAKQVDSVSLKETDRQLSEILFRIGGAFLNGHVDVQECTRIWTGQVDHAVLSAMKSSRELPLDSLALVALGKWGGNELAPYGDLDVIPVTTIKDTTELAELQTIVARWMETISLNGKLLMDPRLRPEGSGSPMVVTIDRLQDYIQTRASAWEKLAWSRARVIGTNRDLADKTTSMFASFVETPPAAEGWKVIHNARKRAAASARPNPDRLAIKKGRGGMMDFEFATVFAYWKQGIPFELWQPSLSDRFDHLADLTGDAGWRDAQEGYGILREWEMRMILAGKRSRNELNLKGEAGREIAWILQSDADRIRDHWRKISALGRKLYDISEKSGQ